MDDSRGRGSRGRLSVMMFLQFFLWGSWFATLGQVLGSHGLADVIGRAYESAPIAAIAAPLFLGLVADRFFASERVMGVLLLIGGGLMLAVPGAVESGRGGMVVALLVGHTLCYMPTLGLGNTIAFTHLAREDFPKVRVWGTIGWIVAGLAAGFLGWTESVNLFRLAAGSALALGVFSFFLPHTPPPAKGEPISLRSLLMVDAFKLLGNRSFGVFMLCSLLICIPLAYYYSQTATFLANAGFKEAASAMTLGQMSEIGFMLLIPFFFRRLGVKKMILIGMLAWVARYLLFAFGAPDQVAWMLLAGVALHGVCYDFFFVTGFMYADEASPPALRSQVQSMLVFATQGLGMFFGFRIAAARFEGGVQVPYEKLNEAIQAARPVEVPGFGEKLAAMFGVGLPPGLDGDLVAAAMAAWKQFWLLPAGMATVIAVVFLLLFREKEVKR